MNLYEIWSLFGVLVMLAAMPSVSVALVVTRSVTMGLGHGIAVSLGIVIGDIVFIFLALFGLSYVAENMSGLFLVIRYSGAIYLFCLGFLLIKASDKTKQNIKNADLKGRLFASFMAGFFLTLGDVKAIFFYVSLLPAFIDLSALQVSEMILILMIAIIGVGGVKVLYALCANRVASLANGFKYENVLRKITGMAMLGAGLLLLTRV